MEKSEEASVAKKTPLGTGIWYRYRHAVYALLAANVAMVSYAVLNQDKFFPTKKLKDAEDSSTETVKDSVAEIVDNNNNTPSKADPDQQEQAAELKSEEKKIETPVSAKPAVVNPVHPHFSKNEQVELYKWMLEEKRKVKPSSSEEKARIDLEKAILKDYIRGKIPSL